MTAQVAAQLHRLGGAHPEVADHPWLVRATDLCLGVIASATSGCPAHELLFTLHLLDAAAERHPRADALGAHLPDDGTLAVAGGAPGEALHLLDLSPHPDGASRRLFAEHAVEADLARLAAAQRPDGGWPVGFAPHSPAAELAWRSYATVQALIVLRRHGRL